MSTPVATRSRRLLRTLPGRMDQVSRGRPLGQVLVLAAIFLFGVVTLEGFSTSTSVKSMLLVASFLGLTAVGQTILIILGHFDFSVPGYISLGNLLILVLTTEQHWAFVPALLAIVVIALIGGGLSGLIVRLFRVESILVTLAANFVLLGANSLISSNGVAGAPPAWLTRFASVNSTTFGVGVPPLVVLWLVVAVGVGVLLRRTVVGRRIYLTGSNSLAAELALIRTRWVVIGAFALSAVSAVITGTLLTGFSGAGDPSIGDPYLFASVTAIVVGGTAIGGRGDYWRTVIGALMVTVINTVLLANGYSAASQQILFGAVILGVATIYSREARLRDRV